MKRDWLVKLVERIQSDDPPSMGECIQVITKNAPKDYRDWAGLLRSIADEIDKLPPQPKPLSANAVGALIQMALLEQKLSPGK